MNTLCGRDDCPSEWVLNKLFLQQPVREWVRRVPAGGEAVTVAVGCSTYLRAAPVRGRHRRTRHRIWARRPADIGEPNLYDTRQLFRRR